MCPECPGKDWLVKTFGLPSKPTGKRPRGRPRDRWHEYISDLAWSRLGVEPVELLEVAVDCEVFRVLLGRPVTSLGHQGGGDEVSESGPNFQNLKL